jgi:hypothetical protein
MRDRSRSRAARSRAGTQRRQSSAGRVDSPTPAGTRHRPAGNRAICSDCGSAFLARARLDRWLAPRLSGRLGGARVVQRLDRRAFAATFDRHFFGGRSTVSRDTVIAAALFHDAMKTLVFGWNDDGSLFDKLTIAGTGGHHALSGAFVNSLSDHDYVVAVHATHVVSV